MKFLTNGSCLEDLEGGGRRRLKKKAMKIYILFEYPVEFNFLLLNQL